MSIYYRSHAPAGLVAGHPGDQPGEAARTTAFFPCTCMDAEVMIQFLPRLH